jgi:hypothetical protein
VWVAVVFPLRYIQLCGHPHDKLSITVNVNNLHKPHKIWCKTISRPPPPQIPTVLSLFWFYEQPDDGPLTRPKHVVVYCILHSDTFWQIVVFLAACICQYIHNIYIVSFNSFFSRGIKFYVCNWMYLKLITQNHEMPSM